MISTPHTVDLNVNWICNLNCPWCWWPIHSRGVESFTDEEWIQLIQFLAESGTQSFVLTGGEPLLKPSLRRLLNEAYSLWSRNTLSTNGILLQHHQDLLDLIHDIWIPLDGSDAKKNQVMRVGTILHFSKALEAMRMIQNTRPHIDLTVRTVASRHNLSDIPDIGRAMIENGINPDQIRWKIYQCSTSGPRRGVTLSGGWLISDLEFQQLEIDVRTSNPQFPHIQFQSLQKSAHSRYFHVSPNWDLKVVELDVRWFPTDVIIGKIGGGSIADQMRTIMESNPDIFIPLSSNFSHG